MILTDGFAQAVYQQTPPADEKTATQTVYRSDGVTLQSADMWRETATLTPSEVVPAVGIFQLDTTYHILAFAHTTEQHTTHTYTQLPRRYLQDLAGNLAVLLSAGPPSPPTEPPLRPMPAPPPQPWSAAQHLEQLQALATLVGGIPEMLALFNAAVGKRRLLIYNPPPNPDRMIIIQGLMALLPACVRAYLTFSTSVDAQAKTLNGRVVFADEPAQAPRFQYDWGTSDFDEAPQTTNPYVEMLSAYGNIDELAQTINQLDAVAQCLQEVDLPARLHGITDRYSFHRQVEQNSPDNISSASLKAALADANAIPPPWRDRYATLLLPHALEEKDAEAQSLIAAAMDANPTLDDNLNTAMTNMLSNVPDLVYVFMRQRLSEGISDKWQARLHQAALHSLDVALASQDPDLILSWLRLLAREPQSFRLMDVVYGGIQRSLPFAYKDSAFALNVLVLASRFVADVLNELFEDEAFMAALPSNLRDAFTDYDPNALAELQEHGVSLFLVGMGRAADARAGAAFEAGMLERIWSLYKGERKVKQRTPYKPESILQTCGETGATWLPSHALETLLGLVLIDRDNPFYPVLIDHMVQEGILAASLPGALVGSPGNENHILDTVSMLVANDNLTSQNAVTVYITILNDVGWTESYDGLIKAVGRGLTTNPDIQLDAQNLQTLLEYASANQNEQTTRAAALKLLERATDVDDEALINLLKQVFSHLAWSQTARVAVLSWWREFAQAQPTARLARLDDALEGIRVTEAPRQTLRTVMAMRRLMGKHDAASFVAAINSAYDVLETLAEAFEPDERGDDISFDPDTVRATLTQLEGDLTPHQAQILSNSLKGMAGLIATMGDNRTKAGLARRSDSIDRQFQIGDQLPQSAVDAMKWIAGFFSGAQKTDET